MGLHKTAQWAGGGGEEVMCESVALTVCVWDGCFGPHPLLITDRNVHMGEIFML